MDSNNGEVPEHEVHEPEVGITDNAAIALAIAATSLKDLSLLWKHDLNADSFYTVSRRSKEGRQNIQHIIQKCENIVELLNIVRDEDMNYAILVSEIAFEEVISRFTTVDALYLLYSYFGPPSPGDDQDWHERVVEKMIESCQGDIKKLWSLFKMLEGEPQYYLNMIVVKINNCTGPSRNRKK